MAKNGMALGGIGAGSVEIAQNGELRNGTSATWANGEARMCGNRKSYMITTPILLPFTVRAKLAGKEPVVVDFVMTGTTANFGH